MAQTVTGNSESVRVTSGPNDTSTPSPPPSAPVVTGQEAGESPLISQSSRRGRTSRLTR